MSAVLPQAASPVLQQAPGFWRRALRHPSFVIGAVLSLLLAAAAALSLVWTPHSPYEVDMASKLLPPGGKHWLGTDPYGRDVVSLLLVGARASIVVGVIAVGIGLVVGAALGLLASARRGWVEEGIMRVADFGLAFPDSTGRLARLETDQQTAVIERTDMAATLRGLEDLRSSVNALNESVQTLESSVSTRELDLDTLQKQITANADSLLVIQGRLDDLESIPANASLANRIADVEGELAALSR